MKDSEKKNGKKLRCIALNEYARVISTKVKRNWSQPIERNM